MAKKEFISNRKCSLCGEIHGMALCPIINAKLEKHDKSKNRNFLMANILLECIHKKISFQYLLKEYNELISEWNDFPNDGIPVVCLDTPTEYFAAALNCSASKFFKNPEVTTREFVKIISDDWEDKFDTTPNFDGKSGSIILSLNHIPVIEDLEENYSWPPEMRLEKKFFANREPEYRLEIQIISVPRTRFQNMDSCSCYDLELISETNGNLRDFFEKKYDECWTDIAIDKSLDDEKFNIWINRLIRATQNNLLNWEKMHSHDRFSTVYGGTDVELYFDSDMKENSSICIRTNKGLGTHFYWSEYQEWLNNNKSYWNRFNENIDEFRPWADPMPKLLPEEKIGEPLLKDNSSIRESIVKLEILFESIKKSEEIKINKDLRTKHIEYADTVVSSTSLICNSRTHSILPYIGIIKLLIPDNEIINYQIYTGYCRDCDKYYIFERDYEKMLKDGTPLCNIFGKDNPQSKNNIPFRYKSQSVLNAMGYTVDKNANLSSDKRHEILLEALQKDFFSIHDLLDFLNWLVATRKTQKKYASAIAKWNEDINFIENYKKSERKTIYISSIYKK